MPINSKAGSEQASVGKVQIKEVTVATFHGSPPPSADHIEFSVESSYSILTWTQGLTINQKAGGRGQDKGKNDKAMQSKTVRAKLLSNGTTMHAHSDHPLANSRSPSLPFTP